MVERRGPDVQSNDEVGIPDQEQALIGVSRGAYWFHSCRVGGPTSVQSAA
jgi:hypothetical protein